jgi:hypothetical protein
MLTMEKPVEIISVDGIVIIIWVKRNRESVEVEVYAVRESDPGVLDRVEKEWDANNRNNWSERWQ